MQEKKQKIKRKIKQTDRTGLGRKPKQEPGAEAEQQSRRPVGSESARQPEARLNAEAEQPRRRPAGVKAGQKSGQEIKQQPEQESPQGNKWERLAKIIEELLHDPQFEPMKAKELAHFLGVPRQALDDFQAVLDELAAAGRIGISARGRYGRKDSFTHIGVFSAHPRGFGFVSVEGRERDIFIPADACGGAMDGDRVRLMIRREAEGSQSAEGEILQVLEHAVRELVGVYRKGKNFGFVEPDNQRIHTDIYIPQGKELRARQGQKVVCRITKYQTARQKPEGVIVEILGGLHEPGVDILSIVRAYGIPDEFTPEQLREAEARAAETADWQSAGRRDFRGLCTVTIDGEDAKDLDDAVSLSWDETRRVYTLYVHIADVAAYVQEHSLLDTEALRRGTSVYLADRVIPMLPPALSNGSCSLNAGEDRLALSCVMQLDELGRTLSSELCESLIHVDKRMSYTGVHALLEGLPLENGESLTDYRPFEPMLRQMLTLSRAMRERRHERGGIDFDFEESRLVLNERGRVEAIVAYERNEAHQLIEAFMLAANEAVAEHFYWLELPFLYRVHENPDPEKMKQLGLFIGGLGYSLRARGGEVRPKELQRLLEALKGRPEEALIARLVLRSMRQAKYTVNCDGHFGLALKYYTHFTSPIRRYPDLQIHRIIKENLRAGLSPARIGHYTALLPGVAQQSSVLERRAEEAEREVEKLKKCEFMQQFIGAEFTGYISGVTNYGIYVSLENTVEGMVPLRLIEGDYFIFDEEKYELRGEMTGRCFQLGQALKIRVLQVDKLSRSIDFILA